ncbi:MAG: hypothetical protein QOG77_3959 [Solirubrobacteraceae bacterium]|jgi:hypothetical protein|nr:hypothetical protein [Solirubrobacteraceae bacterium]
MPQSDAQDDFLRARRSAVLSRLRSLVRLQPGDVGAVLPFDEVVAALGRTGERDRGLQIISLDSIVGSVDRTRDFDRRFRPTTQRVRPRWERIALAKRRGEALPPIEVYRLGDAHFVRDGHHRVSVARAHGQAVIDAHVVEVITRVGADRSIRISDLPLKSHERLFWERVPLPVAVRDEIRLSDPWRYGELAEGVEAWGFRVMQAEHQLLERDRVALRWYHEELRPTIALLKDAGLVRRGETETDAYLRLTCERYRLTRTHEWTDDVLARVRGEQ